MSAPLDILLDFLGTHPRLFVLTGAGCSTSSGIPDYRDRDGEWKRVPPIQFRAFVDDERARQRYWARSMIGWRHFSRAAPGRAHRALADLEALGRVRSLVTQNVDGLHRAAGSRDVIDLHGNLDHVACLDCGSHVPRTEFQAALEAGNAGWTWDAVHAAPDGDADVDGADYESFSVPGCAACGGVLKPTVVFFGESVPRPRVQTALAHLDDSDALLVVGSSLMVFSGYRFVRAARAAGKRVAVLNIGRTRADHEIDLKVEADCGETLEQVLSAMAD